MEEAAGKEDQDRVAMDTGGKLGQPLDSDGNAKMTRRSQRRNINRGTGSNFGRRLDWGNCQYMRQPPTTGEGDSVQVKTTLDNCYAVQTRRRRRLKRG
jgi:hypothetical protein